MCYVQNLEEIKEALAVQGCIAKAVQTSLFFSPISERAKEKKGVRPKRVNTRKREVRSLFFTHP